jgi:Flp pilus assembly protein TadG
LLRNTRGSTLIEFSMLAVPFLVMMFSMVEISVNAFLSQQLDEVVHRSARLIQTGRVHQGNMGQATFKAEACKSIVSLMECSKLNITVRRVNGSFFEMMDGETNEDGVWEGRVVRPGESPNAPTFCVGAAGDYLVVQAVYPSVDILPFVPALTPGDGAITHASTVIRNEPFTNPTENVPGQSC